MPHRRANVTRPSVAVDADRLAREPEYQLVQAAAPLRLRAARAALDSGLLGAYPRAEAVGYLLPGGAQALDRLGVTQRLTTLQEAAHAQATAVVVADAEGLA